MHIKNNIKRNGVNKPLNNKNAMKKQYNYYSLKEYIEKTYYFKNFSNILKEWIKRKELKNNSNNFKDFN